LTRQRLCHSRPISSSSFDGPLKPACSRLQGGPKATAPPPLKEVWESILLSEADMDKHGVWDHVGGQAKALVRLLLQKEPGARPAANELLDHPWFASQLGAELTTLRRLLDKATSPTVVVRS
jgi:calcium-dependent protein kinase